MAIVIRGELTINNSMVKSALGSGDRITIVIDNPKTHMVGDQLVLTGGDVTGFSVQHKTGKENR